MLCENQGWQDFYTNKKIAEKEITNQLINIDHIVPLKLGGSNKISNLIITNRLINNQKSHYLPSDFMKNSEEFILSVNKAFKKKRISRKLKDNLLTPSVEAIYQKAFDQEKRLHSFSKMLLKRIQINLKNQNKSIPIMQIQDSMFQCFSMHMNFPNINIESNKIEQRHAIILGLFGSKYCNDFIKTISNNYSHNLLFEVDLSLIQPNKIDTKQIVASTPEPASLSLSQNPIYNDINSVIGKFNISSTTSLKSIDIMFYESIIYKFAPLSDEITNKVLELKERIYAILRANNLKAKNQFVKDLCMRGIVE